jgi:uncharacterized protein YbaA (DUF1428 family)
MPCVVIDKSDWVTNFDSKYYVRVPMSEAADAVKKAYAVSAKKWYEHGALQYIKHLDFKTSDYWNNFLKAYKPSVSAKSDAAKINEYPEIKYSDFIRILNRKQLAIDDVKSVLTNKSKYNIIYTDKDTYLSKDADFIPKEEINGTLESLFE